MIDFDKLEHDIMLAQKEADLYRNVEDGGTCNFDMVTIKLGRYTQKTKKLAAQLDWNITPVEEGKYWAGWWFVFININGQGNRRTTMVEAAAKKLEVLGWETRVFYEVD